MQLKSKKQHNIKKPLKLGDSFVSKGSCASLGPGETDQEVLVFRAQPQNWVLNSCVECRELHADEL